MSPGRKKGKECWQLLIANWRNVWPGCAIIESWGRLVTLKNTERHPLQKGMAKRLDLPLRYIGSWFFTVLRPVWPVHEADSLPATKAQKRIDKKCLPQTIPFLSFFFFVKLSIIIYWSWQLVIRPHNLFSIS